MQKKHGHKAEAMNSAELAALVDHVILPTTLQQRCDALGIGSIGSPEFDAECKKFARSIGLEDRWYLVMYPFTLSADNCQKHPWVRRLLLKPRLREDDWQELEQTLNKAEDKYLRRQWRKRGERELGREDVIAEADKRDPGFTEQLGRGMLRRDHGEHGDRQPLIDYEQKHGLPYKMKRLRKLMVTRPFLRIVFPHQFMPLTPITPDVHQPIEHRVHELKIELSSDMWKLLKDGKDPQALMQAATYQEFIVKAARRRSNEKGKAAIAGSIDRMLNLIRILKADKDEYAVVAKVTVLPDGSECCHFEMQRGTAGAWAASRFS